MDSSLLAAIQKGKGLKKSPRRPSTARRHSAAKPAASNATTTAAPAAAKAPPPPPPAKPSGGPPKAPPPPPPPPPKGGMKKAPPPPKKAPGKPKAPPPKPKPAAPKPPPPAPPPAAPKPKPAAPPPPSPPPPAPKPKPAAPPPPSPPPPAPKPKPAAPPPPAPPPAAPKPKPAAPPPPAPPPAAPKPKPATPPPPSPPPAEPKPSPAPAPAKAAAAAKKRKSVSFAIEENVGAKDLSDNAKSEISEMVTELRRLSPVTGKSSSKSPIAGLGLDINTTYVPPKKEKPLATQKASPKVRHRRKSALKKGNTIAAPEEDHTPAPPQQQQQQQQQHSVTFAEEPVAAHSPSSGAAPQGTPQRAPAAPPAAAPAADSGPRGGGIEDGSDLEFDTDAGDRIRGVGKQESEAYKRHIPLEPLKELGPLHRIIPLEEILSQQELEEQMMVSTREFNATVRLFKDREKKYQEAIQILEERNRTLQKIVVERDNVVAYLQAKVQSPVRRGGGRQGGTSYRELDLDGMDADEYPVLGMRSPAQMPHIPGLSSYIERPSPVSSSYSSYRPSGVSSAGGRSIGAFESGSSLVDTVYSSPFKQSERPGLGMAPTSSTPTPSYVGDGGYGEGGGGTGGLFSARYGSEISAQASPAPRGSAKKFERRLTKFDKSSIFSKYT